MKHLTQHRHKKSGGFSRTSLSAWHNIPSGMNNWNCIFLNWSGHRIICQFHILSYDWTKIRIQKGLWRFIFIDCHESVAKMPTSDHGAWVMDRPWLINGPWLVLGSWRAAHPTDFRSMVENLNFPWSVLERFHQKYQLGYHHIDRNLCHLEQHFQKALFLVRDHVAKIIIKFWEIKS